MQLITVLAIAAFGLALLAPSSVHLPSSIVLVIGPFLLCCLSVVVQLFVFRREKAEADAGYTTYRHKFQQLAQLDPRTGDVLRAPGQPYLRRSDARSV